MPMTISPGASIILANPAKVLLYRLQWAGLHRAHAATSDARISPPTLESIRHQMVYLYATSSGGELVQIAGFRRRPIVFWGAAACTGRVAPIPGRSGACCGEFLIPWARVRADLGRMRYGPNPSGSLASLGLSFILHPISLRGERLSVDKLWKTVDKQPPLGKTNENAART